MFPPPTLGTPVSVCPQEDPDVTITPPLPVTPGDPGGPG